MKNEFDKWFKEIAPKMRSKVERDGLTSVQYCAFFLLWLQENGVIDDTQLRAAIPLGAQMPSNPSALTQKIRAELGMPRTFKDADRAANLADSVLSDLGIDA